MSSVFFEGHQSLYKDRDVTVCGFSARAGSLHPDSTSLYLFFLGTLHIFVLGSLARLGLFAASYLLPQLPALYLSGTHGRRRQMPAFEPQADASVRVITRLGRKMHHRVPSLRVSRSAAMAAQATAPHLDEQGRGVI